VTSCAALQPNAGRQKYKAPRNRFQEAAGWKGEWRKVVISRSVSHHGRCVQLSLTHSRTPGVCGRRSCLLEIASVHVTCNRASVKEALPLRSSCRSRGLLLPKQLAPDLPSVGGISHSCKSESQPKITSDFNIGVRSAPRRADGTSSDSLQLEPFSNCYPLTISCNSFY